MRYIYVNFNMFGFGGCIIDGRYFGKHNIPRIIRSIAPRCYSFAFGHFYAIGLLDAFQEMFSSSSKVREIPVE